MKQINWKSGLVRVWMVLSAIWIALVIYSFIKYAPEGTTLIAFMGRAFGPPIILLVAGIVISWVKTGFFSTKTD